MSKSQKQYLSSNQLFIIFASSIVGTSLLSINNSIVNLSGQDAWISVALGGIYPLFIGMLACIMYKKNPNDNILVLSKKHFGKFIGAIFNFIFLIFLLFYLTSITAGFSNLIKVIIASFLTKYTIIIIITIVCAYAASKKLEALAKMNQVLFYITVNLVFFTLFALKQGSILNIMPICGSGLPNILKGFLKTVFAYGGMEIIFLLYPYAKDYKTLKKSVIGSSIFVIILYTWMSFITIYYVGINMIPKFLWSLMPVIETVIIPIINNFRYIFVFLYCLVLFKTISNYYFASSMVIKDFLKKVKRKNICFAIVPLLIYLSYLYGDEIIKRSIDEQIINILTLSVDIPIIILTIILLLKEDDKKG